MIFQFFQGFLDHNQLEGARRIDDMFPFIKKTSIWRRHVEVTHRESPLLVMTMQHRSRVCKKLYILYFLRMYPRNLESLN